METTNVLRPPAIVNVPSKSGQFHGEDHLRTGDFNRFVTQAIDHADHMTTENGQYQLRRTSSAKYCILHSEMAHDQTRRVLA